MKKYICFIIFAFIFQLTYSQACGGGKFEIDFYTKSADNLQYKITEVKTVNKEFLSGDISEGTIITKNQLKEVVQSEFDKSKLPKFISESVIDQDIIENNELSFNTLELYNKLFLLKVWSTENEVYILANLFGGCDRKIAVIMISENPQLIAIKEE